MGDCWIKAAGCMGEFCVEVECRGDILLEGIVAPGLCKIFCTETEPGEGEMIGPGLLIGELCWVKGDAEADGDIIGDCELLG